MAAAHPLRLFVRRARRFPSEIIIDVNTSQNKSKIFNELFPACQRLLKNSTLYQKIGSEKILG